MLIKRTVYRKILQDGEAVKLKGGKIMDLGKFYACGDGRITLGYGRCFTQNCAFERRS